MSRKHRHAGKKKRRTKRRAAEADAPPLSADEMIPALVDLKLRVLRTVRALDAVGIQPAEHRGVPAALLHCAELDSLLTQVLELHDREPLGAGDAVPTQIADLLSTGTHAVEEVFAALPRRQRQSVRSQLGLVGAAAPEVWLEVDGLRSAAGDDAASAPTEGAPQEVSADADELFALGPPRLDPDERVARLESEELPDAHDPRDWLLTLPLVWLRTIARMWRLDPDRDRSVLADDLASTLVQPDRLAPVLAEGLGRRERMRLAALLLVEAPLAALHPEVREGLEVPWDWSSRLPPGTGGKLRAFGLVFVGTRDGTPVIAVPPAMREPLVVALREADPKGWRSLPPAVRDELEEVLGEGEDDWLPGEVLEVRDLFSREVEEPVEVSAELLEWRELADRVTSKALDAVDEDHISENLLQAFCEPLLAMREVDEHDLTYLALLAAYDWRDGPGAATMAEEVLATAELTAEERSILDSQCRSRPRLYRIVSATPDGRVELEDAFVQGPARQVDAPEIAAQLQPGWVFPARVFDAGPFTLLELMGAPLPPEGASDAVACMQEMFETYAGSAQSMDRESFLQDVPVAAPLSTLLLVECAAAEGASPRPVAVSDKPEKVYVLDVELMESDPPVTRRLQISGHCTLDELHSVLQQTLGWEDDHLHLFEARDGSWRYSDARSDDPSVGDEMQVTLDAIAPRKGSRFYYEYDFGDSWWHEIRVAERLDPKKAGLEPRCLGGQNACPPEDSGGVAGYAWKLEVLADVEHPDHWDVKDWMGEDFDPTEFDLDEVNRRLLPDSVR